MKTIYSALVIIFSQFISSVLFAQNNSSNENFLNIEGTVVETKDPKNPVKVGLSGAKMILMDKNYKIILSKYSNKEGKFSLQAMPNTQYFVVAEKKGYGSKRISVTTAATFDAAQDQITIELLKTTGKEDDRSAYLQKVVDEANDLNSEKPVSSSSQNSEPSSASSSADKSVVFKIQFGKFTNPAPVKFFASLQDVEIYREDGLIVYAIGNYRTLFEANTAMNELKAKGFKDSFVVAYLDGKKISNNEAAALAPKQ